jgi:hypothetical protein
MSGWREGDTCPVGSLKKSYPQSLDNSCSRSSYFAPDGQSASMSWCRASDFNFLCLTITFFLLHVGHPLWREEGSAVCSAITQWSELGRTRNHTLLSRLRLPQLEGSGSRSYTQQELGVPVILPGTGFPLRHLLRLAGLRWRYSNPPPHGTVNPCHIN